MGMLRFPARKAPSIERSTVAEGKPRDGRLSWGGRGVGGQYMWQSLQTLQRG